jgi:hypothetical protein
MVPRRTELAQKVAPNGAILILRRYPPAIMDKTVN